ncbi:MAG: hypothetical protein HY545_01235 [Candidatus Doudnabacteria bacterium]|nr:hypothetical protein [Candidatus Doudnabacteria bacterium]
MKMPKKVTTEDLARMMAKGFEEMATKENLKAAKNELSHEISGIKQDLEAIELRIGHLAYAFEVKDLKRRMAIVERKIGVK